MKAALKYPGAKWSYCEWIVSFFPQHRFYLEPYFGSGATFFNKPAARFETINDIDGLVVNFFKVCRDYPEKLATAINLTPFSRQEFNQIQEEKAGKEIQLTGDCVEDARLLLFVVVKALAVSLLIGLDGKIQNIHPVRLIRGYGEKCQTQSWKLL